MKELLPVGIIADIDECFCYKEDESYQQRCHGYLERYEVPRGYRDTAVQVVVTDIALRAFQAGLEGAVENPMDETLIPDMLETAAKLVHLAQSM